MKALRIFTFLMAFAIVLSVSAAAVQFTPSVERKDGPELVDPVGDDELIITPVADLEKENLHDDIEESLTEAKENLSDSEWAEIVKDFEELWEEFTNGAPIEHAVISDIFDVRFLSELGTDGDGKTVTFKIKVQGIEPGDLFMIITESNSADHYMEIIDYTIDENGVITITATSMAAFAIVIDSCPDPECDHDSPQTGVPAYFVPAVFGAVFFGALAILCAVKLRKASAK